MISEDLGVELRKVTLAELGRAKKVMIDKDSAIIVEGAGKPGEIAGRARRCALRSNPPRRTTTARNCRSGWRNWSAASR